MLIGKHNENALFAPWICNFDEYRISLNAVSLRDDTTRVSWAWSQKAPTWGLPTRWLVPRVWFARYWHQQSRAQSLAVKLGWRYTQWETRGLLLLYRVFFQVKRHILCSFCEILLELLIQLFCLVAFDCWEHPMLLGILWQNAQNMMEPLWCLFTRVKNRWNLKEKLLRRGVEFHKREGSQLKSVNWHES